MLAVVFYDRGVRIDDVWSMPCPPRVGEMVEFAGCFLVVTRVRYVKAHTTNLDIPIIEAHVDLDLPFVDQIQGLPR